MSDLAQDRAIERPGDNRLNRIPFVGNLVRALVIEESGVAFGGSSSQLQLSPLL